MAKKPKLKLTTGVKLPKLKKNSTPMSKPRKGMKVTKTATRKLAKKTTVRKTAAARKTAKK